FTGDDAIANFEPLWRKDIAPLAVIVAHQRDPRRAVRVVFDGLDSGVDVGLIALEINDAVEALVTPSAMARGNAAGVVPATGRGKRLAERLIGTICGQIAKVTDRVEPRPWSNWFE